METYKEDTMLVDDIHFSELNINTSNDKKRSDSESCKSDTSIELRRSTRKRIRPLFNADLIESSNDNAKRMKQQTVNNTVKMTNTSLETIFEEPLDNLVMSKRKLRRFIKFAPQCVSSKVVKRRKKSKTLKTTFRKATKKAAAAADLLLENKLRELENLNA
uniref:Tantalus-like domain-containing protein n=1 Tax=Dendroctonus ponderosae TaxID=77166 RepID=A0AAR5PXP6_DENPD